MSEKYVVLILGPLVVNPLELLFSGKPFIANFKWKAHLGSRIYVIDRQSGKITSFETDPLFVFHHINARDEKEKIIVDFLAYNDSSIVDDLYLKNLDTGNQPAVPLPTRLHIDLNTNSLTKEALHDKGLELPIINYKKCSTKEYKYFYAVGEKVRGDFLNQLVKTEWENNKTSHRFWYEKDCFPGEPIFVANPRPVENREDDGILLSIVTNSQENRSFILGLDARDMSEMFRAELPHIVPFNFHGQFREIAK